MTPPRKPREFDDGMLLRQLRRRIPDVDGRTEDLLVELRSRLWYREYKLECHDREMDELSSALDSIEQTVEVQRGELTAAVEDLTEALALKANVQPPSPRLRVVEGGDDA